MEKCPKCKAIQYSKMDKKYLELYGQCWACDREDWNFKKLSLKEFEKREAIALAKC